MNFFKNEINGNKINKILIQESYKLIKYPDKFGILKLLPQLELII